MINSDTRKMNLSLRAHLGLFALIPVCFVIGLSLFLSIRFFENALERYFQEDVELIARAIRLPLVTALDEGDQKLVRDTLESTLRIQRVNSLAVYNEDGEIVSKVNRGGGEPNIVESVSELEQKAKSRKGVYEMTSAEEVYSFFTPLSKEGGKSSGFLEITRKKSDIDESLDTYRTSLLSGAFLIMLVISILIFATHNRSVQLPLDVLRKEMDQVRTGNLTRNPSPQGPYEIRELYLTFNHMVKGLKRAYEEVSARQDNERLLEKKLQRVEKLAAVGRLGAGIAHELGTPLSVVDGIAQRAIRRVSDDKELLAYKEIREETARMERIIRQLLEFSRVGVVNPNTKNIENITLERSLRKSLHSLTSVSDKIGAEVVVEEGDALYFSLYTDPVKLEQVLQNLIKNAIEAAGSGGHVKIAAGQDNENIYLTVDDSGAGIPEEARSKIFEPFFTTKKTDEGIGLGLAVAHGIVEEMGGELEACRGPLKGARFKLVLPKTLKNSQEPT